MAGGDRKIVPISIRNAPKEVVKGFHLHEGVQDRVDQFRREQWTVDRAAADHVDVLALPPRQDRFRMRARRRSFVFLGFQAKTTSLAEEIRDREEACGILVDFPAKTSHRVRIRLVDVHPVGIARFMDLEKEGRRSIPVFARTSKRDPGIGPVR